MKTLKQYSKELNENKDNPKGLSNLYSDLASRYAYYSDKKKELDVKRAEFWQEFKMGEDGKQLSDMKLKMLWIISKDGNIHNDIKIDLKACEKLMGAINSIGITNHHLSKNDY